MERETMTGQIKHNHPKRVNRFSDGPTPEYLRKHRVIITESENGMVNMQDEAPTSLKYLHNIRSITDDQLYAGQRYHTDWYYSAYNRVPRTLWDELRKPSGPYIEGILDCTRRYDMAVEELVFESMVQRVVQHVAVYNSTIQKTAFAMPCDRATASKRLKEGLDMLVKLYGKII